MFAASKPYPGGSRRARHVGRNSRVGVLVCGRRVEPAVGGRTPPGETHFSAGLGPASGRHGGAQLRLSARVASAP